MTRLRHVPVALLPVLAVLGGTAAVLAGVFLLAGLAWTLIAGGVVAVAAGLLVDLG